MKEVFFRAELNGETKGIAAANSTEMAQDVVSAIEAKGWTAHIITELQFHIMVEEAKEGGRLGATIGSNRELKPEEVAALMARFNL